MEVNYNAAIQYLYPQSKPNVDYVILAEDGKQTIHKWNMPVKEPTEKELQDAWNKFLEQPREEILTPEEKVVNLEEEVLKLKKDIAELHYLLMMGGS